MKQANKFNTPILVIAWKRPEKTAELINKINEIYPKKIYLACDGANRENSNQRKKVEKTRQILLNNLENIESKKYLFSEFNQGCKAGVSNAINWFFKNEKEGIILEDDCIPHLDFFEFCEKMLEIYRHDSRIWSITGHNQQNGIKRGEGSYYFSKYPRSWGWATWRRCWKKYDSNIIDWPIIKKKRVLTNLLTNKRELKYWEKILDNIYKFNSPDTWDYQWTLSSFLNNGLTIVPNINLIKNIGFDKEATHTFHRELNIKINDKGKHSSGLFPIINPKYQIVDKKGDEIIDTIEYSGGKLSKLFFFQKLRNLKIKLIKFLRIK